jgi:contact-dependent growth inhibition (CDI) system CdiI-like immunity protein
MPKSTGHPRFPALREFLRGYFHQDLADEYGSPKAAAIQFSQDADTAQRKAVAREWSDFMKQNKGRPLHQINESLRSQGSGWNFESLAEIESIAQILRKESAAR